MDFTQDPDAFISYLSRVSRESTRARDNFLGLIDHWKLLSEKKFGGLASVELLPESKGFSGAVLGKNFTIDISPIAVESVGLIEAIVAVKELDGGKSEVGRFRLNRDGDVVNSDSSEAGNPYNDMLSMKILMGILRAVLEAPAQVKA